MHTCTRTYTLCHNNTTPHPTVATRHSRTRHGAARGRPAGPPNHWGARPSPHPTHRPIVHPFARRTMATAQPVRPAPQCAGDKAMPSHVSLRQQLLSTVILRAKRCQASRSQRPLVFGVRRAGTGTGG